MHSQPQLPIFQSQTKSPLGDLLLAATSQGLAGVWFVHHQINIPDNSHWVTDDANPLLCKASTQLCEYFEGKRQTFELTLHPAWGTPFQQSVWKALQRILFGQTCTYGNIALNIGRPKAVRAVGAAIGKNPCSIIIPCHRVVGANGALTGFAGGLDRKNYLLSHEAVYV